MSAARWADKVHPWQACLEEAWEACCSGCVPIGAVVTGQEGEILARGRNRIFEDHAPAGMICQNELAHAEMNALISLGIDRGDRRTWALYTTTEPCPMCLGAFYMSGIRTLHYASRDPWAGSVNLLGTTPYLSRKPIQVHGPQPGEATGALEGVVFALFVAWECSHYHERFSLVSERMHAISPAAVNAGRLLSETGQLARMIETGCTAAQVYEHIESML